MLDSVALVPHRRGAFPSADKRSKPLLLLQISFLLLQLLLQFPGKYGDHPRALSGLKYRKRYRNVFCITEAERSYGIDCRALVMACRDHGMSFSHGGVAMLVLSRKCSERIMVDLQGETVAIEVLQINTPIGGIEISVVGVKVSAYIPQQIRQVGPGER